MREPAVFQLALTKWVGFIVGYSIDYHCFVIGIPFLSFEFGANRKRKTNRWFRLLNEWK